MSEQLPPEVRARLLRDAGESEQGAADPELLYGRYRVTRELGRGGMGVVYEAEDVALRRRVALKVLNLPALAGPGIAEQVLREARAAARLDHPNIAAVYDAHDDAIVLQFIDGKPLSQVESPDVRQLVRWMRDAALAVHHAHEHGIIHRDIKPHNLMVDGERVVVTDFGIAKELAADSTLSLSGSVLGTPSYMPPEQAGGRAREVDARSDVYALGATLYDLLAGRPPFVERDVVALLRAVVEEEPAPLERVAGRVPRDLALVVHKCLEKEKERRYASALELAEDLERWLAGEPVRACAPSLGYRTRKLLHRRRGLVAALCVLALFALGFGAWNWNERAGRRASEQTLALVDDVNRLLASARMLSGQDVVDREEREQLLEDGIARCHDFLARQEAHQIRSRLGSLQRMRGHDMEALQAFEQALREAPDYAPARLERGLLLHQQLLAMEGAGSDAARGLRARVLADLMVVETHAGELERIDSLRGEATLADLRGRRDTARRLWKDVQRLDPRSVDAAQALARLALAGGDPDEAMRQAFGAMDLFRGFEPQGEPATRGEEQPASAPVVESSFLEISGIEGRFTDHGARNSTRPSTAGAYAQRAQGQVRRAARAILAGKPVVAIGALTTARSDLGNALTIAPHLAGAHGDRGLVQLALARALTERGRGVEAEDVLADARADLAAEIAVSPGPVAIVNHAIGARQAAEDALARGAPANAAAILAEAIPSIDHAIEREPTDAGLFLARARILEMLARWSRDAQDSATALDRAITDFDHAVALAPWDARPRGWRGIARIAAGDAEGGRGDLEKALFLGPEEGLQGTFERALASENVLEPSGEQK